MMLRRRWANCLLVAGACLLLSACATTSESPGRLSPSEFASWVDSVNKRANLASVSTTGLTTPDRVNRIFEGLIDAAADQPGEAPWVVRVWHERSGNITTLFDYFLSRNYLLNYYFFDLGSTLLIPVERDRYGLTLADRSLDAIFGNEQSYVPPWVVDDRGFVFGTSYGGAPVVNRARVLGLYEWVRTRIDSSSLLGSALNLGAIMQLVAANEVAHATLFRDFSFTVDSPIDTGVIKQLVPGLPISNARQLHEFVSDAASVGTHPAAVFALTANLFKLLDRTADGGLSVDGANAYSPSAVFYINTVQSIVNRRGRKLELKKLIEENLDRPLSGRQAASAQIASRILEVLGPRGYQKLVGDYHDYARRLVQHIGRTNK